MMPGVLVMALVVPAEGTFTLMGFLQRGIQLNPFVGLFVNDVTPDVTFTLASLVEASFVSYVRKSFGVPTGLVPLPGGAARLTWPNVIWTAGPGGPTQTCFGYFVTQLDWTATPRLLWVERVSPKAVVPLPTVALRFTGIFDFSTLFT